MPRAKPLVGSVIAGTAVAASTVSGRKTRGIFRESSMALASEKRKCADCSSLQWRAPSIRDQNAPAASASSGSPPSSRAPMANRIRPRSFNPSACASRQGKGCSSGSHASSRFDSSLPVTPRLSSCRAIALRRGSPRGNLSVSSSSRRSRHQAMRIAPSAGSVVVATTSAKARSRFQSVAKAGRTIDGNASSAVSRS